MPSAVPRGSRWPKPWPAMATGASESRPVAILLLIICLWIFILLQFGQTFLPAGLKRRSWGGRP